MDIRAFIRKPQKANASQDDAAQLDKPSGKGGRKPGRKRGLSVSTVVMTVVMVVGLGIIAYPTFSDWWNSFHQTRAIAAYSEAVDQTDPKKLEAMLQAAREYNTRLAKNINRFTMTDEERKEYNSMLNLTGNGVMGYVTVPSIGVNLPVYHGVDEVHLQVAVGHIEGTSLPVGGKGTHTAVSAHRGLPSAKLFTDLDKIVEGDIFTFTVLNQTLTYEVDQIRIVEPSDLSDLAIDPEKDYATLITCTPYGINTHRILVRGHRIENQSDRSVIPAGAIQIPIYIAIPAVAIPLLFMYLLVALLTYRRRRNRLNMDQALDVVRKHAMSSEPEANNTKDDVSEDHKDEEE